MTLDNTSFHLPPPQIKSPGAFMLRNVDMIITSLTFYTPWEGFYQDHNLNLRLEKGNPVRNGGVEHPCNEGLWKTLQGNPSMGTVCLAWSPLPCPSMVRAAMSVLVTQLCPTLCYPMDCSPVSSVHGILQARILEWVAIPCSRGSSQPRDQTQVSPIAGRCVTTWATREALRAARDLTNHVCLFTGL